MEFKIKKNPRNKLWVLFQVDPKKKGKFGMWKILETFATKAQAKKKLRQLV